MRYVVCLWMHRMAGDSCLGVSQHASWCKIDIDGLNRLKSNLDKASARHGKGKERKCLLLSPFYVGIPTCTFSITANISRPFEPVEPGNLHPTQKFTLRHEMRHKIQVHEALTCCMHANVVPNSYQ